MHRTQQQPPVQRKRRGRPKGTPGSKDATSLEGVLKSTEMPQEAKIVALILQSMGVEEYEPNVIHQFLEFMHRYVADVLQDALVYADHASKSTLDLEDVRLAIQSRVNYSFTQPPPRDFLLEMAQSKNSIPLPFVPSKHGVRLPPPSQCVFSKMKFPTKPKTHQDIMMNGQHDDASHHDTTTTTTTTSKRHTSEDDDEKDKHGDDQDEEMGDAKDKVEDDEPAEEEREAGADEDNDQRQQDDAEEKEEEEEDTKGKEKRAANSSKSRQKSRMQIG